MIIKFKIYEYKDNEPQEGDYILIDPDAGKQEYLSSIFKNRLKKANNIAKFVYEDGVYWIKLDDSPVTTYITKSHILDWNSDKDILIQTNNYNL